MATDLKTLEAWHSELKLRLGELGGAVAKLLALPEAPLPASDDLDAIADLLELRRSWGLSGFGTAEEIEAIDRCGLQKVMTPVPLVRVRLLDHLQAIEKHLGRLANQGSPAVINSEDFGRSGIVQVHNLRQSDGTVMMAGLLQNYRGRPSQLPSLPADDYYHVTGAGSALVLGPGVRNRPGYAMSARYPSTEWIARPWYVSADVVKLTRQWRRDQLSQRR